MGEVNYCGRCGHPPACHLGAFNCSNGHCECPRLPDECGMPNDYDCPPTEAEQVEAPQESYDDQVARVAKIRHLNEMAEKLRDAGMVKQAEVYLAERDKLAGLPPKENMSKITSPAYDYISAKPEQPEASLSLSLLIIDLGDQCVIRAENNDCQVTIGGNTVDLRCGEARLCHFRFSELRRDIDATDSKPVPRLERRFDRTIKPTGDLFLVSDEYNGFIDDGVYTALCELAGVTIPIWTGSGTWTKLIPFLLNDMYSGGDIQNTSWIDGGANIEIWRYSR